MIYMLKKILNKTQLIQVHNSTFSIKSASVPQCGQLERSSNNFGVDSSGTYSIQVPQQYLSDSPRLEFAIKKDISLWTDKTLTNYPRENKVELKKGDTYYLANPKNAFTEFEVLFVK